MAYVKEIALVKPDIAQTVEKERGKLFNFIRKRVKSTLDAEDILQDVFYQFIRVQDEVQKIEKVSSWLFQVARNRITDLYRKKKPANFSQFITSSESDDESSLSFEDYIPDLTDLPDATITREMVWEILDEGLNELPEEQREVFKMHEFEDLSFNEISEITGEGVNTLISRKRYAILHLRKKLDELYREIVNGD
ncbi:MAG: sigma-70 family RNA polymerase sigma factor [Crocinitomicaceae bacterium]|nr:sigma-70 family RNA polymerase sigma factor [Crocinitomicaceae bacterium]MBK8925972.1 sigma-70 family RNA polymerase sigma factor [Crocinitomicaceae bacterium]